MPFPLRYYLRSPDRLPDMHGYFDFDEDEQRGRIVLANTSSLDVLVDTLCEELAHARTAHLCDGEEDPHHPTFWAEYGRIVNAARERAW